MSKSGNVATAAALAVAGRDVTGFALAAAWIENPCYPFRV
jgi:hypothetical protein